MPSWGETESVVTGTATDSVWHALQGLIAATGNVYLDGTSNTGSPGTPTPGGNTLIGNGVGGFLTGAVSEAGTIASNASANFSALNSNQHSFWSF
jgi:hypothetical protein